MQKMQKLYSKLTNNTSETRSQIFKYKSIGVNIEFAVISIFIVQKMFQNVIKSKFLKQKNT
jgi:hypothetical protein